MIIYVKSNKNCDKIWARSSYTLVKRVAGQDRLHTGITGGWFLMKNVLILTLCTLSNFFKQHKHVSYNIQQ